MGRVVDNLAWTKSAEFLPRGGGFVSLADPLGRGAQFGRKAARVTPEPDTKELESCLTQRLHNQRSLLHGVSENGALPVEAGTSCRGAGAWE